MPRYVILFKFTEQGRRNILKLGSAAQHASRAGFFEKAGVKPLGYYWVDGQYDIVAIMEGESDEQARKALMVVTLEGNMTWEVMRAYTNDEIAELVAQVPAMLPGGPPGGGPPGGGPPGGGPPFGGPPGGGPPGSQG